MSRGSDDPLPRAGLGSRNLILTGFMGTGKTEVGRELARRLGREFVDMDLLIQAREGLAIAEIFLQRGEGHFRRLEADLCRELAAREQLVIATGGGALVPEANYEMLSASGPVVCLAASADEVLRRLATAEDRPLLDAPDRRARIAALLAERSEAYRRIPLQVDTTGLTTGQVTDRVLGLAKGTPARTLTVGHPGGDYSIHLGAGLLSQAGAILAAQGLGGQVALVTTPPVGEHHATPLVGGLERAGFRVAACSVPDGEAYKTLETVRSLYDCFIDAGLDRQGAVLALGGGVVGDMAGFAAATYLRGVQLVQLPTSLLAMVDSSVGGKVAVDHRRGKNLVGAFKQPSLVIADTAALATLPPREFAGGLAEVVKAGLIGDPALFGQIEDHGPAPIPWLIERAIGVKVSIVEEDPYERGRRAVLNLGHTFGHALELLSGYLLSHGEAVGIGLVAAARLSGRLGLCEAALPARVQGVLGRLGLPTRWPAFTPEAVWDAMARDKKRRAGRLRFVLIRDIGEVSVTDEVSREEVVGILEELASGQ